ncbi:hypothetical protein CCHR01_04346 [Colletotrichum chrysophilum]|uniref:Uncharacterized protein n=1 Tax=Colletotrichum chrysophilum TaxID=1836956 RepID=A0AAD9AR62_9PEZI|nr:hypothetical protein CCHR01_04346 [Colletotrichum chrysophilum]
MIFPFLPKNNVASTNFSDLRDYPDGHRPPEHRSQSLQPDDDPRQIPSDVGAEKRDLAQSRQPSAEAEPALTSPPPYQDRRTQGTTTALTAALQQHRHRHGPVQRHTQRPKVSAMFEVGVGWQMPLRKQRLNVTCGASPRAVPRSFDLSAILRPAISPRDCCNHNIYMSVPWTEKMHWGAR